MRRHLEGFTFHVGDKPIEFCSHVSHLGHKITSKLDSIIVNNVVTLSS